MKTPAWKRFLLSRLPSVSDRLFVLGQRSPEAASLLIAMAYQKTKKARNEEAAKIVSGD